MYQKYDSESQNIKRSMIVLSLSLVLVYIVLYYAKGNLWTNDMNMSIINTGAVVISDIGNGDETDNNKLLILTGDFELGSNQKEQNVIESDKDGGTTTDDIVNSNILSGTKTYYGELDFVELLGISYDYVLKDDKNIYYVNMGEYDYDFSDIARKLKGSLYVMNTEQELIANNMFGDKVTYINIPEYENQKVLILLEVNNQSWLLAIDYAIYHQVKSYLKTLFID